jgi:hypothetical protein
MISHRRSLFLIAFVALALLPRVSAAAATADPAVDPSASTFKPGVLLQAWYAGSDAGDGSNSFRIRRAELSGKGEILPKQVGYAFMLDAARLLEFQDKSLSVSPAGSPPAAVVAKQPQGGSSVLQDVFITYMTRWTDASVGQFKTPVSWEGYNSASRLLFPERALIATKFGDKRDLGLRLTKQFQLVGYSAGVFNGAGVNTPDSNRGKDGAVRFELYPVEGLVLAGVVYGSLWRRRDVGSKDRYEGDLRLARGPFLLQGEYIYGRDRTKSATGKPWVAGDDFYTAVAWTFLDVVQVAGRVGALDPDKTIEGDHTWSSELTVNWSLKKYEARAQLALSHLAFEQGKAAENGFIVALQTSY